MPPACHQKTVNDAQAPQWGQWRS